MTYLQRHTCIPTPTTFDWVWESDPANSLEVDYILMGKLDGKLLNWARGNSPAEREAPTAASCDISRN